MRSWIRNGRHIWIVLSAALISASSVSGAPPPPPGVTLYAALDAVASDGDRSAQELKSAVDASPQTARTMK